MTLVKVNNLGEARMGMSEDAHNRMVGSIGAILNAQSVGGNTAAPISLHQDKGETRRSLYRYSPQGGFTGMQ